MPSPRYSDESLPGFVKPDNHIFYADDPPPHEMTIKISNPYGFHVKYKVLSSDAEKYTILSDPQGYIKPMNFQEITICHKAVIAANINCTDTIRVQLFVYGQPHPHYVKNISVTLHALRPDQASSSHMSAMETESERFQQLSAEAPSPRAPTQAQSHMVKQETGDPWHKLAIIVISTIVCLVALCLPCPGDEGNQYIPSYLYVTHTLKLIVAYILGLLTTLFMRL